MLRSLFSAVSGLRSHQTMMDVVGNNIANVNTAGFKSSQAVFQDTLSQMISGASAPAGAAGGTNPAQVGLGTRIGAITTNFAQGASQLTGRSTDVAIQGDGFFVVKRGAETLYSRAGSFSFDAVGNLTNPDGGIVQGWMANGGVINANAPTTGLKLPIGQTLPPTETQNIDLGGNLPADAALNTKITSSITAYDSQGTAIPTSFTFEKTAADTWSVTATMPNADGSTPPATVGTGSLAWNASTGKFGATSMTLNPPAAVGTFDAGGVNVTLGTAQNALTQYAAVNSVAALAQDGAAMGTLQS